MSDGREASGSRRCAVRRSVSIVAHAGVAANKSTIAAGAAASGDTDQRENQRGDHLFELLNRLQSARLDDQRCAMPASLLPPPRSSSSGHRQQMLPMALSLSSSSSSSTSAAERQRQPHATLMTTVASSDISSDPSSASSSSSTSTDTVRLQMEAVLFHLTTKAKATVDGDRDDSVIVLPLSGKSAWWCEPESAATVAEVGQSTTEATPAAPNSEDIVVVNRLSRRKQKQRQLVLRDTTTHAYRTHFAGYEHANFLATDAKHGAVVVSVKTDLGAVGYSRSPLQPRRHIRHITSGQGDENSDDEDDGDDGKRRQMTHVIIRTAEGTIYRCLQQHDSTATAVSSTSPSSMAAIVASDAASPLDLVRSLAPDLKIARLQPVVGPAATELIANYDAHLADNTYKFGLIYQAFGQLDEESIFGNVTPSPAFEQFMSLIGQKVALATHSGFRGGLDCTQGQTGRHSLYETMYGQEVMFHVSTFLPHSATDRQQLQRKRHIGNDIVVVVFQDRPTPFSPAIIASNFIHAYVIVSPIFDTTSASEELIAYRLTVVGRHDVPRFGPSTAHVHSDEAEADDGGRKYSAKSSAFTFNVNGESERVAFKRWMLAKLINAQRACLRATQFARLERRTRAVLLERLHADLLVSTRRYITATAAANENGYCDNPFNLSSDDDDKMAVDVGRSTSRHNLHRHHNHRRAHRLLADTTAATGIQKIADGPNFTLKTTTSASSAAGLIAAPARKLIRAKMRRVWSKAKVGSPGASRRSKTPDATTARFAPAAAAATSTTAERRLNTSGSGSDTRRWWLASTSVASVIASNNNKKCCSSSASVSPTLNGPRGVASLSTSLSSSSSSSSSSPSPPSAMWRSLQLEAAVFACSSSADGSGGVDRDSGRDSVGPTHSSPTSSPPSNLSTTSSSSSSSSADVGVIQVGRICQSPLLATKTSKKQRQQQQKASSGLDSLSSVSSSSITDDERTRSCAPLMMLPSPNLCFKSGQSKSSHNLTRHRGPPEAVTVDTVNDCTIQYLSPTSSGPMSTIITVSGGACSSIVDRDQAAHPSPPPTSVWVSDTCGSHGAEQSTQNSNITNLIVHQHALEAELVTASREIHRLRATLRHCHDKLAAARALV